jgi:NADH-quinone oxidoreductase subunit K
MNLLTLADYLIFSAILLGIGIAGMLVNKKNIIVTLMCLEIILLAVNTNFIAFSKFANDSSGQIFVFFIITVAAIKTAIGLAILMLLFRKKTNLSLDKMNELKW